MIRASNGEREVVQSCMYLYEIDVENRINEQEKNESAIYSEILWQANIKCSWIYYIVGGIDFEGEFDVLRVVKPDSVLFHKDSAKVCYKSTVDFMIY